MGLSRSFSRLFCFYLTLIDCDPQEAVYTLGNIGGLGSRKLPKGPKHTVLLDPSQYVLHISYVFIQCFFIILHFCTLKKYSLQSLSLSF